MFTVGFNFTSQPDKPGGTGRRMYTKTYEMPAIPRVGETISSSGGGEDFLPGPVTAVSWVHAVDRWLPYLDIQTDVAYADSSYDDTLSTTASR